MSHSGSTHPIGVFDSGIGGLSILQALRTELPQESFVYVADSGHAPYGERDDTHVIVRARTITNYLREQHEIKLLVVACNTATAAAIQTIRSEHPDLPIVGVEPALKPALLTSQTRRIGVMATRGTLASEKFRSLLASLNAQAEFICQPCDGLAAAIEQDNAIKIEALCEGYTRAIGQFGTQTGQIDSLVLGCTHYPFANETLQVLLGHQVQLFDAGAPVARQVRRVLAAAHMLTESGAQDITLCATGSSQALQAAALRWLSLGQVVRTLQI